MAEMKAHGEHIYYRQRFEKKYRLEGREDVKKTMKICRDISEMMVLFIQVCSSTLNN